MHKILIFKVKLLDVYGSKVFFTIGNENVIKKWKFSKIYLFLFLFLFI